MRFVFECRRPAVSMITTSAPRFFAAASASKTTAEASCPCAWAITGTPIRSPHNFSCSIAAARNVSAAARMTRSPSRLKARASLAMLVVLPTPFTPTTRITAGLKVRSATGSSTQSWPFARARRSSAINSSRSASRASSGRLSPSLRTRWRTASRSFVVVSTPTSAPIRISSSSSHSDWSISERSKTPSSRPKKPRRVRVSAVEVRSATASSNAGPVSSSSAAVSAHASASASASAASAAATPAAPSAFSSSTATVAVETGTGVSVSFCLRPKSLNRCDLRDKRRRGDLSSRFPAPTTKLSGSSGGGGHVFEAHGEHGRDAITAHGDAVDRTRHLHRGAVMADEDELRALGQGAKRIGEAAHVRFVERGINLVEHAERGGIRFEQGEEQRDSGHGTLAAAEQREMLLPFARQLHEYVDAAFAVVLRLGERQPRVAAAKEEPKVALEIGVDLVESRAEALAHNAPQLLERRLQVALRLLQIGDLAGEEAMPLGGLCVVCLRLGVDRSKQPDLLA